jgi:hypothetical protein
MRKKRQNGVGARAIFLSRFNQLEVRKMSRKEKPVQDGELSEQQLDKVAGGQEVRKMETIVVTAKRLPPEQKVVKMETIVVTAQRDKSDIAGTKLAQADSKTKKN